MEQNSSDLSQSTTKGSALLVTSAISSHDTELLSELRRIGYPQESLISMEKCGISTGQFIMSKCDCSFKVIPLTHKCNLRTCLVCSQRRKRRIFNDYIPIISQYTTSPYSKEFLYFLTIAPEHCSDLKQGIQTLRKNFNKFIRNKYVKDRIKGGLYVIETKNIGNGYHVHLHAIINGRWLDNRIRGFCPKCKQNLIKKDRITDKYYCGNRNCNNTENLYVSQDSKIVQIWKNCSKKNVHIHIQRQFTPAHTLNYMLKYISSNKNDFQNIPQMANYIYTTRKQKLITKFGSFFDVKFPKAPCLCKKCGSPIEYIYDMRIIENYFPLARFGDTPLSVYKVDVGKYTT